MQSKKKLLGSGITRQELRCPRCGDQYVKSTLTFDAAPFEMDPFCNFKAMKKQGATTTHKNDEAGAASQRSQSQTV
jgi:hypothetical protein